MTPVNPVVVQAVAYGGVYLLWCNRCGPMGASDNGRNARQTATLHVEAHGCEED